MNILSFTTSRLLLLFSLLLCGLTVARAAEIVFPADAGIINVKVPSTFGSPPGVSGAAGNGTTDDTAAIQAAIHYAVRDNSRYARPYLIYLPNGTYKVSDTIASQAADKSWGYGWCSGVQLIGQSRAATVIKLQDSCASFTDAAAPKPVIKTASENPGSAAGGGNQAFRHSILNLTVDVGSGNAGAIGISYLVSNRGSVRDVTVRSSDPNKIGFTGIDLRLTEPGPGLLKNVEVIGFDSAFRLAGSSFCTTMENISIRNQRVEGFYNNHVLFVRGLTSQNSVPVIRSPQNSAFLTLIDANFTGGAAANTAIENGAGRMLIRNLQSAGYGTTISNQGGTTGNVPGTTTEVAEWTSHPVLTLFPSAETTLGLPIEETPTFESVDLNQWANATAFGATKDDGANDDAVGIQAAIDAGQPIVYLPRGGYAVNAPIVIRGKVRKIIGFTSSLSRKTGYTGPIFRFDGGDADAVMLEHLNIFGPIVHNGSKALSLRNCDFHGKLTCSESSTGKLFLEDVIANPVVIGPKNRLWARQLNIETGGIAVDNVGGTAWILGLKTENRITGIKTSAGGKSELLGGFMLNNTGGTVANTTPAMICDQSQVALSFNIGRQRFAAPVQETRDGETKNLGEYVMPRNGGNQYLVLFSSKRLEPK